MTGVSGTVTYSYESGSNLLAGADGSVEHQLDYDGVGRLKERRDLVGGQTFTTKYEYDLLDRLDELTYPDGRIVEYRYDTTSRITHVEDITSQQGARCMRTSSSTTRPVR